MVDKIFKIGLLVLGFSYLAYLFCPVANQVGRYQLGTYAQLSVAVLDTATADMYIFNPLDKKGNNWVKRNPILERRQLNKGGEKDGS